MDRGIENLILDNIKLVYYTLHKMNILADDDLVSEGMLALVQAAQNFNPSFNIQFSTYAVSYIKGKIKTYLTVRKPIIKPSRINGEFVSIDKTNNDIIINAIPAPSDNIESSLIVRDFLEKLTYRERVIAEGLMQDKTQQQLGKELNICQGQVCRIIRIIRYKYLRYIRES